MVGGRLAPPICRLALRAAATTRTLRTFRYWNSDLTSHDVDASNLRYQYDDSAKLRVRAETHRLYSAQPDRLRAEILEHLALSPGLLLLDLGCGPGGYHASICTQGVRVVGADASGGMVLEAKAAARANDNRVAVAQTDAQTLPFRSAVFDRVLAAHMLYHVRDREAALHEMRRTLRAGGRAVLVTNGAAFLDRLARLHQVAAMSLGYVPTTGDGRRFTLDDLPLVRSVFPATERYVLDNALVFHEPEPALRYYASGPIDRIRDRPADGSHRARLLPLVQAAIETIVREDGEFRDPKPTGCFVATVAG